MIVAMISWGISWPAAKIVGQYAKPESLIAWRFFVWFDINDFCDDVS